MRKRDPLRAGADGVNHHAGALSHFDGFGAGAVGEIVFTVADQNHYAAHDVRLIAGWTGRVAQLVQACGVDGVVNGGAAACASLENFVTEGSGVAGEFLDHLRLVVEGHDEGFVFVMTQDAEEEICGGVLFEFQTVANAVGSVEQHSYAQRKIGLLAEIANFLRGFIVKNFEVAFFQVGDEFVAAI